VPAKCRGDRRRSFSRRFTWTPGLNTGPDTSRSSAVCARPRVGEDTWLSCGTSRDVSRTPASRENRLSTDKKYYGKLVIVSVTDPFGKRRTTPIFGFRGGHSRNVALVFYLVAASPSVNPRAYVMPKRSKRSNAARTLRTRETSPRQTLAVIPSTWLGPHRLETINHTVLQNPPPSFAIEYGGGPTDEKFVPRVNVVIASYTSPSPRPVNRSEPIFSGFWCPSPSPDKHHDNVLAYGVRRFLRYTARVWIGPRRVRINAFSVQNASSRDVYRVRARRRGRLFLFSHIVFLFNFVHVKRKRRQHCTYNTAHR